MYGTYSRLKVRTFDSDFAVVRAARRKLNDTAFRDPAKALARKAFYRTMLEYHHDAQAMCREFRI